jgi:outer membrane protein assembly factor BamB
MKVMQVAGAVAVLAVTGAMTFLRGADVPRTNEVYSEQDAWRIGWPQLTGPLGNFLPLQTRAELVDDLAMGRLLWISEDADLGWMKTGSQSYTSIGAAEKRLGEAAEGHPGSWSGMIAGDGKLFGASFRPAGPFFEVTVEGREKTPAKSGAQEDVAAELEAALGMGKGAKTATKKPAAPPKDKTEEGEEDAGEAVALGEVTASGKIKYRLDAEDLVLAMDPDSGRVLWKTVEPGGLVVAGGKRAGFQVVPAYFGGRLFSLGTTGRLFAHDGATGRKLWQSDIGPAYQECDRTRTAVLADVARGKLVRPRGPGWHTSLVVADGVLVAPTFTGPAYSKDVGLRGYEVTTGSNLWEVAAAIPRWATPSVWRHDGREYLLCATVSGNLRLIDPRDGKVLWTVNGLGANYMTLAPSDSHVLVNVRAASASKQKVAGLYGAFALSAQGAEKVWVLPDEAKYGIPTWFDSCARQRYAIRGGLAYVPVEGDKEHPGPFLILDEKTGRIVQEFPNLGPNEAQVGGLTYLLGNGRLICRTDSAHGARHGGRHPFIQWKVGPDGVSRMDDEMGICGLDPVDFQTAYEVFMEPMVVAGRMFDRTADGRVACYDLRVPEEVTDWRLTFENGFVGLTGYAMPVQLWTWGGDKAGGKVYPPDAVVSGLGYGFERRWPKWEQVSARDVTATKEAVKATLGIGYGTHVWPTRVEWRTEGARVTGRWVRSIEPLAASVTTSNTVSGHGPYYERTYSNVWRPGEGQRAITNASGVASYTLECRDALAFRGGKYNTLTLYLDHDGTKFVRCVGADWHEGDTSRLQYRDGRITGTVMLVINSSASRPLNPSAGTGIAGRMTVDAAVVDGKIKGSFRAEWGIPCEFSGAVTGFLAGQATGEPAAETRSAKK